MKRIRPTRVLTTTVLCLAIGLVAAGCGGSESPPAATEGAGQQSTQAGAGAPGGSGKVTEVSGSTAQVQGQGSQVAVSWTGGTTFTQQVSASPADVVVGSCVMVTSNPAADSSTTAVTAASVRITEATGGSCTAMGGGRPGGSGQGGGPAAGGEAPSGSRPTDMPSGAPGGGERGGFAVGQVLAVSGSGFTVSSQRPDSTDKATKVSVTTSSATTYTTTAKAAASDIKVGVCVMSRGEADDTGALTASTIGISPAVDGECTGGFGGGRPAPQA